MATVVLLGATWLGYQRLNEPACTGRVDLTVAAADEIVPAVRRAADGWHAEDANVRGTCIAIAVTPMNSATMAAAIAGRHGVSLTGLGQASGAVTLPDVWIPDSSMWLLRLRSEAPGFVPRAGRSIARSPVVVAMPEPVAQRIGWPDRKLGWADLLTQITSGSGLRTGIVDPTRDAAGLAGLLALGAAAGSGRDAQAVTVGALRALAAGKSALREDLLQEFPRSQEAADIAQALNAAPLSEQDVIAYNAERPPIPLAALYLDPVPPALDYPFAVLPEADPIKAAAADGLLARVTAPAFRDVLAAARLRGPDGQPGAGFAAPIGAPVASGQPGPADGGAVTPGGTPESGAAPGSSGTAGAGGPDTGAINQVLGTWAAITLPGRVLAVFDVSGSMLTKVPTAGNATRAQVTQEAARRGLALFDDQWAVGVWVFSTELRGKQDWREIAPIRPVSAARAQLQAAVKEIVPKRNGATGLYDTTLAAYRAVQDTWEPGRVNSVILFTDGKNQDDDGLSRSELITKLKRTADPDRPVRMIIVGIGAEVDRGELEDITNATGGGVFTTEDPAKIGEIFLEAISSRTSAPR